MALIESSQCAGSAPFYQWALWQACRWGAHGFGGSRCEDCWAFARGQGSREQFFTRPSGVVSLKEASVRSSRSSALAHAPFRWGGRPVLALFLVSRLRPKVARSRWYLLDSWKDLSWWAVALSLVPTGWFPSSIQKGSCSPDEEPLYWSEQPRTPPTSPCKSVAYFAYPHRACTRRESIEVPRTLLYTPFFPGLQGDWAASREYAGACVSHHERCLGSS